MTLLFDMPNFWESLAIVVTQLPPDESDTDSRERKASDPAQDLELSANIPA